MVPKPRPAIIIGSGPTKASNMADVVPFTGMKKSRADARPAPNAIAALNNMVSSDCPVDTVRAEKVRPAFHPDYSG
jgi:hypothetical protein